MRYSIVEKLICYQPPYLKTHKGVGWKYGKQLKDSFLERGYQKTRQEYRDIDYEDNFDRWRYRRQHEPDLPAAAVIVSTVISIVNSHKLTQPEPISLPAENCVPFNHIFIANNVISLKIDYTNPALILIISAKSHVAI